VYDRLSWKVSSTFLLTNIQSIAAKWMYDQ
jgi:hypothetical protein